MAKSTTKKSTTAKPVEGERQESTSTEPGQGNVEAALQHPSLAETPKPGVEVAERSADQPKPDTEVHRKTYVLLKREFETNTDSKAGKDELHLANIEQARQAMIHQGLRPTDDGKFVKAEDHPDGVSICLHYDIPAVPAVVALAETGEQSVTHAHVTLDDQHAAEKDA